MAKKRLVVRARKDDQCLWAWQGGYIEEGVFSGRPCYQRDTVDGGDKYYIFYHSTLKSWFFSESLPVGPRISFIVRSEGNAKSPEEATWDPTHVQELFVQDKREEDDGRYHGLFVDPEFPHDTSSINRPGRPPIALVFGEPHWIPGRRLRQGEWQLFDGIDARDLLQGKVGDCWLLAAIAAMAEFPNEIRRVFLRDGLREGDGRYVVRLFDHHKGDTIDVTVDEFVPCHPWHWWISEADPYFARANGNELWCLILEKAMAKVYGSYGELNGGSCSSAFRSLTGMKEQIMWERRDGAVEWTHMTLCSDAVHVFQCPKKGRETLSSDLFFSNLREWDEKNYLMAASIRGDGETARPDGLVEGHCYSVAQAQDIVLEGKGHLRLLELRNPWGGDKEWKGVWSDGHASWDKYPEVAHQLRPSFEDDGAFWMSWEDFASIFTNVFVCPKAMREGDDAIAHALASGDWRKYRPPVSSKRSSPPSRSTHSLPLEAMTSVKAPPKVIEAPRGSVPPGADAGDRRRSDAPPAGHRRSSDAPAAAVAEAGHRCSSAAGLAGDQRRRWQVELKAGVWTDFPEDQQQIFASAEQNGKESARFEARGQVYDILFKERVQRNLKTGRDRQIRRAPLAAPEGPARGEVAFQEGDHVHVWSASLNRWATDGIVVKVLVAPYAVDGLKLPPGSIKVSYDAGRAEKWLAPQQLAGRVRRARGDDAPGATPSPAPFRPPARAAPGG